MPHNIPLHKINALTHYFCKSHNHCADENELVHCEQTKVDNFYSSLTGSMPLVNDSDGNITPVETLNGDKHSDDYDRWRASSNNAPRERMLQMAREKHLYRPTPNKR